MPVVPPWNHCTRCGLYATDKHKTVDYDYFARQYFSFDKGALPLRGSPLTKNIVSLIMEYYLGFSHFLGIGPVKFQQLKEFFGTVQKAYEAPLSKLKKVIGAHLAEEFVAFRQTFDPQKKLEEFERKNIIVLTQESKHYPPQLLQIPDPPICLYVKGDVSMFDFATDTFFAVVGTRKPTSYGQQVTRKLTAELASAGFVVVSGMAFGIDTISHMAALDWEGKTVAVLGCGVDIVYPPANKKLYERIVSGGGVVMSEFPPGMTVLPGLFIARNRLISGLSRGVLVVEGAADSGALITARFAAQQGKDMFATPAPITSEVSAAPNILLKEGARLVTSVQDIFEEFGMKVQPSKQKEIEIKLSDEEKKVFEILKDEPKRSDELAESLQTPIHSLLNLLSQLEIKAIIEKNSEGRYQVRL